MLLLGQVCCAVRDRYCLLQPAARGSWDPQFMVALWAHAPGQQWPVASLLTSAAASCSQHAVSLLTEHALPQPTCHPISYRGAVMCQRQPRGNPGQQGPNLSPHHLPCGVSKCGRKCNSLGHRRLHLRLPHLPSGYSCWSAEQQWRLHHTLLPARPARVPQQQCPWHHLQRIRRVGRLLLI